MTALDVEGAVGRAADTIHWAFDEYHQRVRAITGRVFQRYERRDWAGIRQDTVDRLALHLAERGIHSGARVIFQLPNSVEFVVAYFAGLKSYTQGGGNLVLTDAALKATAELGIVATGDVKRVLAGSETDASNYNFSIATGNITYKNPAKYPLAAGVGKPGAAEQAAGRRQAVEPSPIQDAAIRVSALSADAMAQPTAWGNCVQRLPEIVNTP